MKKGFKNLIFFVLLFILFIGPLRAEKKAMIRLGRIDTTLYPTNFMNVVVFGPDGKPIENLKPSNFKVYEDGKEQKVLEVAQANEKNSNVKVVLVIDCSSSMRSAIGDTKDAAKAFIKKLSPGDKAALISFSNSYNIEFSFTDDQKVMESAIERLKPRGSTALYAATDAALDLFKDNKEGNPAILVLTDGRNNGPGSLESCIDKSLNAGVPVFTIGLGNHLDLNSLTKLAQSTGGIFKHAPTSSDLEDVYKSLATQLKKQLWIKYVAKPQHWPKKRVSSSIAIAGIKGAGAESFLTYIVPVQWWKIILSFLIVELILIILTYFLFRFFWRNMNMDPVGATNLSIVILTILTLIWYTIMFISFIPILYFLLIALAILAFLIVPVKFMAK